MEEAELMRIAESIPDDWYTDEDAKEITSGIFYQIMIQNAEEIGLVVQDDKDFQKLLDRIAEKNDLPVDEVIFEMKNVAMMVGAVKLFEVKYPQLVAEFPRDFDSRPVYPAGFLAKILGVDAEIAQNLIDGVLQKYKSFLMNSA